MDHSSSATWRRKPRARFTPTSSAALFRAQTISFNDYITYKGEGIQGAKEAGGKMRAEGKEYVVHDGDVMNFPVQRGNSRRFKSRIKADTWPPRCKRLTPVLRLFETRRLARALCFCGFGGWQCCAIDGARQDCARVQVVLNPRSSQPAEYLIQPQLFQFPDSQC